MIFIFLLFLFAEGSSLRLLRSGSFDLFLAEHPDICKSPEQTFLIGQKNCGIDGICKTPGKACAVKLSRGAFGKVVCIDVPTDCQNAFKQTVAKKFCRKCPKGRICACRGFEVHERIVVDFQYGANPYDCVVQETLIRRPCQSGFCPTTPSSQNVPFVVARIQSIQEPQTTTPGPIRPIRFPGNLTRIRQLQHRLGTVLETDQFP